MDIDGNIVDRNGTKYLRVQVNGRRFYRSLGTSVMKDARPLARNLLKAIKAQRFDLVEQTRAKTGWPAIGEVLEVYAEAAAVRGLRPETIKANQWALHGMVRAIQGEDVNVARQKVSILTAEFVEKYATQRMMAVMGKGQFIERRTRRSINSTLRQARSLFAQWTVGVYESRDLKLPDMSDFLRARPIPNAAVQYVHPSGDLIDRTMKEGRKLRESRPDLYAVFLLCYDLGLRSGEAVACQWHWFRRDGTLVRLDIVNRPDFLPKGRERSIPISPSVWSHLEGIRSDGPYVLPGDSPTARKNLIGRDFATWMRGVGWDRRTYPKAAHELRKLIGSRWYTERSAEVAQTWLGHTDVATTCRYYASLTRMPDPLELDGVVS